MSNTSALSDSDSNLSHSDRYSKWISVDRQDEVTQCMSIATGWLADDIDFSSNSNLKNHMGDLPRDNVKKMSQGIPGNMQRV